MHNGLDLTRFIEAHKLCYKDALREIKNGRKRSHWMWFIFPQVYGISESTLGQVYAIHSIAEAATFLQDPYLGSNLLEISHALLELDTNNVTEVFDKPDDMKLQASMTLFSFVPNASSVFRKVLEKYYDGKEHAETLERLRIKGSSLGNSDSTRVLPDPNSFSIGTSVVMADSQIKYATENGFATLETINNDEVIVKLNTADRWFVIHAGSNDMLTAMMGAACGDVAGSVYEHHNIKYKLEEAQLIHPNSRFTDDTVMTCAVADGIMKGLEKLPRNWMGVQGAEEQLVDSIKASLLEVGTHYPNAGYGGSFRRWLKSDNPKPYGSWGNGSAMRASYAGWVALSIEEAEKLGEISAAVTHNHPEGIKGAKVVAGCIFLLKNKATKNEVKEYAKRYYDLDFTLDEIRDTYTFDVSCQGSVPQSIAAFLEGNSFSDVISLAISIGGDSDTIAAIAGSIAEAYYPIPQDMRGKVIDKLDGYLLNTIADSVDFMYARLP